MAPPLQEIVLANCLILQYFVVLNVILSKYFHYIHDCYHIVISFPVRNRPREGKNDRNPSAINNTLPPLQPRGVTFFQQYFRNI